MDKKVNYDTPYGQSQAVSLLYRVGGGGNN